VRFFLEEVRRFSRADEAAFFGEEEGYLGREGKTEKVEIEEGMVLWRERLCLGRTGCGQKGKAFPRDAGGRKSLEKLVFSSLSLSRSKTGVWGFGNYSGEKKETQIKHG